MQKICLLVSVLLLVLTGLESPLFAQHTRIEGFVLSAQQPVPFATICAQDCRYGTVSDINGYFQLNAIPPGEYTLLVSAAGYRKITRTISLDSNQTLSIQIELPSSVAHLHEVVISGSLKEISKSESPVPVEVYSACFFRSNPGPSVFEALQNINGVRPQINCNICNTGDIHINGLEGPYTMVMIDGMPVVSGLSTVYGLSGIPQSLIERVELIKGPASTLYGSEAVGGLINIITRKMENMPEFAVDAFGTSWAECNLDLAGKTNWGKKAESLTGFNAFYYQTARDVNRDGFTDIPLQKRVSLFHKLNVKRRMDREFLVAGRYVYEDRWGGEMNWSPRFHGSDSIYGEHIDTRRWECFGTYQLPLPEQVKLQFSLNGHNQYSAYGKTLLNAQQFIGFGQLIWNRSIGRHDLLSGMAIRYTHYDDNTVATFHANSPGGGSNLPSVTRLPGIFIQDDITFNAQNRLLVGVRYDHHSIHGPIFSPRVNYKWNSPDRNLVIRLSLGNGFRVVNVFTEDHAALTGAREIRFLEELKPESSWNGNANLVKKFYLPDGCFLSIDASAFYTHFSNQIIPDYISDPNLIIYGNMDGYAVSRGLSCNTEFSAPGGLQVSAGCTFLDAFTRVQEEKSRRLFSERFSGVWNVEYSFRNSGFTLEYTGNVYSPMNLPLLSQSDPRKKQSPWWSIQNIQLTRKFASGLELFAGIKNLLNWTPNKGNPFIIARSHDPFDKLVKFGSKGEALVTAENPYGLTFDPSYVYGPNQGIRFFLGLRYRLE